MHPYALSELQEAWESVKRFHDHLATLSPKAVSSQISKDVLMDIFNSSGVHLGSFGTMIEAAVKVLPAITGW